MKRVITCVECPMGCEIEVVLENGAVISVRGNTCPRGKAYAENEVTCPRRVVTSSVRMTNGEMLPVKTNMPVKKSEIFTVMKKINALHPAPPVHIGDSLLKNVSEDADIIATGNIE